MWVDRSGAIGGTVTIGGCVDARVIEAAGEALAHESDRTRVLDLSLDDQQAWEIGLTCGGSVEVLVEVVGATSTVRTAYAIASREIAQSRRIVVAALLDAPQHRLVIDERGPLSGSLGATALDEAAIQTAPAVFDGRMSRVDALETPDGTRRVFFEYLAPPRLVVIVGAVEVARSLVTFTRELGMRSIVIDPRDRFLTPDRFPDADELRAGIPSQIVRGIAMSSSVSVVLVAHDYKFELPVLREVLRGDAGYIGMLGGRKRRDAIRSALHDEGFTDGEIARIHSPIGLDIGARSTAEIALAIAAELVAVERHAG
jgi:xanthine dehydrogenase accessory factor